MKDHSIIMDTVVARRKRNANGDFALVVDTKEESCKKIGHMGRQHAIVTNVVTLTEELTVKNIELKELKRELTTQKKLIVDIQAANLIVEDIRKQISLNTKIQAIKEEWIRDTKEAIQEVFLGITIFFIEVNGSFVVQGRIHELITMWGNNYLAMHDLRRKVVGKPVLLEYYHQFFYQYDWLFYAISKCQDFTQIRTNFKEDLKRQLREY